MNSGYLENLVIIQEDLRFAIKILGLECVLTTITTVGTTMNTTTTYTTKLLSLSPMLHAAQWDILLAVKVKEYSANNHNSQSFCKNLENL